MLSSGPKSISSEIRSMNVPISIKKDESCSNNDFITSTYKSKLPSVALSKTNLSWPLFISSLKAFSSLAFSSASSSWISGKIRTNGLLSVSSRNTNVIQHIH